MRSRLRHPRKDHAPKGAPISQGSRGKSEPRQIAARLNSRGALLRYSSFLNRAESYCVSLKFWGIQKYARIAD